MSTSPARAGILGDDFAGEENRQYNQMPRFRVALDGGYSKWMLDPDSETSSERKFYDKLERGTALSAQAVYWPWPQGGVGVEWIWHISHATGYNIDYGNSSTLYTRQDRNSFQYYGPTFCSRLMLGRLAVLQAGFGGGWLFWRDNWTQNGKAHKLEADNFALVATVGCEWPFSNWVGVGFSARYLFSNVQEYKYDGVKVRIPDDPRYMSNNIPLERIEAVAGLRFYL